MSKSVPRASGDGAFVVPEPIPTPSDDLGLETIGEECPDGGACWHNCTSSCWRVSFCGPLSVAKFPGDRWPETIRVAHPRDPDERSIETLLVSRATG